RAMAAPAVRRGGAGAGGGPRPVHRVATLRQDRRPARPRLREVPATRDGDAPPDGLGAGRRAPGPGPRRPRPGAPAPGGVYYTRGVVAARRRRRALPGVARGLLARGRRVLAGVLAERTDAMRRPAVLHAAPRPQKPAGPRRGDLEERRCFPQGEPASVPASAPQAPHQAVVWTVGAEPTENRREANPSPRAGRTPST